MVLVVVSGDDTQALRNTISSLCSLNTQGDYAQLCNNHDINDIEIDDHNTWNGFFSGLAYTPDLDVTELVISYAELTALGSGVFSSLKHLNSLSLSSNSIASIAPGAFSGLGSFYCLDLSGNQLTVIPSGVFSGLGDLTSLDLGVNSIASIESGAFDGLSNLQSLDLIFNSIKTLQAGLFSDLGNLYSLGLYYNSIASLQPGVFSGLKSLNMLHLSQNSLTSLDSGIFNDLSLLNSLDLYENSLKSLPATVFSSLSELRSLRLGSNKLSFLPSGIFDNNINLRYIYLENNKIASVPDGAFSQITSLLSLRFQSNSLTHIDLGNATPTNIHLESNYLVSFLQDAYVVNDKKTFMYIYLDHNCLIESQLPDYKSPSVRIDFGSSQSACVSGTCSNEGLRNSGCFMCSEDGNGDSCVSCLKGNVLYVGRCVECLSYETCPFNNNNEIYCVNDSDLSHCLLPDAKSCSGHVCAICGNKIVEGLEECDGSEHCGSDCICEWGYEVSKNETGVCVSNRKSSSTQTNFAVITFIVAMIISLLIL